MKTEDFDLSKIAVSEETAIFYSVLPDHQFVIAGDRVRLPGEREVLQLQQHVVAQVLRVQGEAEGADVHAVFLKGPEDLLRGDGLVALHGEVPDE